MNGRAGGFSAIARWTLRAPRYPFVWLLRLYRLVISPLYGDVCKYYPSCSAYALDAFEVQGVFRGFWLTARRLLRCNPWSSGGVDYVPGSEAERRSHLIAGADRSAQADRPAHADRPDLVARPSGLPATPGVDHMDHMRGAARSVLTTRLALPARMRSNR